MSEIMIHAGEHRTLRLSVTDLDLEPVNLSGSTVWFTVRKRLTHPKLIEKSSSVPTEAAIVDGPGGVAEIYLVPEDTADLKNCYLYDVWLQNLQPGGTQHTIIEPSTFRVERPVTDLVPPTPDDPPP